MHEKRNAHYYTVDESPTFFPGSTTALGVVNKPALVGWSAKVTALKIEDYLRTHATGRALTPAEISLLVIAAKQHHVEIKEHAADIGTRAHKAIDRLTSGEKDFVLDHDVVVPVNGFLDWQNGSQLKIVHGDLKLIYLHRDETTNEILWGYGGSLDGIAIDANTGRYVVVDYKTSNGMWETYPLQIASYCYALKYTYGLHYVPEGYCARFDKEVPGGEVAKLASVPRSFVAFTYALFLYESLRNDHFLPSIYFGEAKPKYFKKPAEGLNELSGT